MRIDEASSAGLLIILFSLGFNVPFWSGVAAVRLFAETLRGLLRSRRGHPVAERPLTPADVAVVIPARNEEAGLPKCIHALLKAVHPSQIHIASDGSTDATVAIARQYGCNVLDIQPNGGKAQASSVLWMPSGSPSGLRWSYMLHRNLATGTGMPLPPKVIRFTTLCSGREPSSRHPALDG
jgi:cellulose synthase/poly-beta-1,6-N-acetylglucosamine synthase-like glycosyltransferase